MCLGSSKNVFGHYKTCLEWANKQLDKKKRTKVIKETNLQDIQLSTLANSTLIILFSDLLKISKIISSKSKIIMKYNSEYLRIFYLLK
jgi:hypothetical protein